MFAGDAHLARREFVSGVSVPQLEGDQPGPPQARQPEPAPGVARRHLHGPDCLKRTPQQRQGGGVPLRQAERERVQHHVRCAGRVGRGWRRASSLGRLVEHARGVQVRGPDGRADRLEVRGARHPHVQRLQTPGRADEQARRVAHAPLIERNLAAQVLGLRGLQGRQRAGFGRTQQLQCGIQPAGDALRARRRQKARRASARLGRERRGALEEGRGSSDASASSGPDGRAFQLLRDQLIRTRRRVGVMPCAPVRVDPWVGGVGERCVQCVALASRG